MRPRQWIENLLVFMAPAAAGVLGDPRTAARVVGAFVVFCLVASGTYLVNDVVDAASDRYHPAKRHRPVASGELRPSSRTRHRREPHRRSASPPPLLIGPWGLAVVVVCYAGLNVAYTLRLKQGTRRRAGRRGLRLRAAGGRRRCRGRRQAFQLVPRLHVLRGPVRPDREAICGVRSSGPRPRCAPGRPCRVLGVLLEVHAYHRSHRLGRRLLPVGVRPDRPAGARRVTVRCGWSSR